MMPSRKMKMAAGLSGNRSFLNKKARRDISPGFFVGQGSKWLIELFEVTNCAFVGTRSQ